MVGNGLQLLYETPCRRLLHDQRLQRNKVPETNIITSELASVYKWQQGKCRKVIRISSYILPPCLTTKLRKCVGSYSHIAFTVIETLEFYVQELRKRVRPL